MTGFTSRALLCLVLALVFNTAAGAAVVFRDPTGDDNGPGGYIYPTDAVYTRGSFDLTRFELSPKGRKAHLAVGVNSNLQDPWGMGVGFAVQMIFVFIDNAPGGFRQGLPGINVQFAPGNEWDKVIILSPQPVARVLEEVRAKLDPAMWDAVVLPARTTGRERTISAQVDLASLGEGDPATWGYQVIMQSNESFPAETDLLTRRVNEYEGQHRFGGGTDTDCDPNVLDILGDHANLAYECEDDGTARRPATLRMERKGAAPPPPPPPPPPSPEELARARQRLLSVGAIGDIQFHPSSAELTEEEKAQLAATADFLKDFPDWELVIEGHTSEVGTNESNMVLAERRAHAAFQYLTAAGVDPGRLATISMGEERPVCTESTEECWRRNDQARFRVTRIGELPPAAADSDLEPKPRWNSWASKNARTGKAIKRLPKLETVYEIVFDLSAWKYSKLIEDAAPRQAEAVQEQEAGERVGEEARKAAAEAADPAEGRARIWVQPVLLGGGLEFAHESGRAMSVEIASRYLMNPPAAERGDSTVQVASLLSALREGEAWAPLVVKVNTLAEGCGAVALSIWDARPNRPLDYVYHQVPIGTGACSEAPKDKTLPERLLRRYGVLGAQEAPDVDAALHVFEMDLGAERRSLAVFLQPGADEPADRFITWVLPASLSSYVQHEDKLLQALNNAREAEGGYDVSKVSESLKLAIFSGPSDAHRLKAGRALTALEALARGKGPGADDAQGVGGDGPPSFYARLVNAQGQSLFLPLGLLEFVDDQPFGGQAKITQPLLEEDFGPKPCIRDFTVVIPESLQEVPEEYLAPAGDGLEWIRQWEGFKAFAQPAAELPDPAAEVPAPADENPEGLVLLAHHNEGAVWFFRALGTLAAEHFFRRFKPGSVAVFIACSATELADDRGEDSEVTWVEQLQGSEVDAMILSPFEIDGAFGARFAVQFARQVELAGQRPRPTPLRKLFADTVAELAGDRQIEGGSAEAFELLIAGNGELELCGKDAAP